MGGTSTDVALCDSGAIRTTNEAISRRIAGGGFGDGHSHGRRGWRIDARVDEGGSLRVGPESAGADPGPACYGRSLLPTVTDAHVVLGHFGGDGLLGGEFKLDEKRAREAMAKLANDLSKVTGKRSASSRLRLKACCRLQTQTWSVRYDIFQSNAVTIRDSLRCCRSAAPVVCTRLILRARCEFRRSSRRLRRARCRRLACWWRT